jgi:FkbM family methyltransferase
METKIIGRMLRSFPPTARLLTEYRVHGMVKLPGFADLAHCMRLAKPGTTAVDVGASVGNYAVALRKAVGPRGRVLALEANPAVYKELVHSSWLTGIDARNVAASSTSGTAELLIPVDSAGRVHEPIATLEDRGQAAVRVRVPRVRLDDQLSEERCVSVIKIDVEGHESEVIRGAVETLQRHKPGLVMEIEAQHVGGADRMAEVVALCCSFGYRCSAIHGTKLIPWDEFDVDRWQTQYLSATDDYQKRHFEDYVNNFLFIHESREL